MTPVVPLRRGGGLRLEIARTSERCAVVNRIDDAVVTASGRTEAFQLTEQRFAEALWVFRNRTKDGCKGCFAYLRR